MLTLQSEAIEQHTQLMRQLKDEETKLLKEETALRALEEQRMQEEKKHKQEETKAMLDYSVKLKMKRKVGLPEINTFACTFYKFLYYP